MTLPLPPEPTPILPCPWCGEKAEIVRETSEDSCWIACSVCDAHGPSSGQRGEDRRLDKAVAAWNRVAAFKVEIERLRAALLESTVLMEEVCDSTVIVDVPSGDVWKNVDALKVEIERLRKYEVLAREARSFVVEVMSEAYSNDLNGSDAYRWLARFDALDAASQPSETPRRDGGSE